MAEVITPETASTICRQWKESGKRLVFTNGIFDLLHVGHAKYLQAAKAFGDKLVVGVNSDASVRSIKGPLRPILPAADRAELLASLVPVDLVVIFEDTTASGLIELLKPDIYVKGGDWAGKELPESDAVKRCGGEIHFVPTVPERSTSDIISTIVERYCGIEHGH